MFLVRSFKVCLVQNYKKKTHFVLVKPSNGSYHCLPSRVNEHCARNKEEDSLGHSRDDYWGEVELCGGHQDYQECVFQGNKSLLVLSSTRSEIESGTTRFFYK